ncbi:hypothetical protein GCM10023321_41170 [Pseudonocardia eucalypti]|uniref:Membrane protein YczE n=1 Tax=Pseudonocardia eucalypti TaxID=648755 RepID=A0ABP9QCP4_9PSEU
MGLRLLQMFAGSAIMGVGMAVLVRCSLGLMPWDIWHMGLSEKTGWTVGVCIQLTNAVVLLGWLFLRVRPGVGTICGVLVPGWACDRALELFPAVWDQWTRLAMVGPGAALFAGGTAFYLAANLGPGPRDGLMTGMVQRYGLRIWPVRASIEVVVLIIGLLVVGAGETVRKGYLGWTTLALVLVVPPLIGYLKPRLTLAEQTGAPPLAS